MDFYFEHLQDCEKKVINLLIIECSLLTFSGKKIVSETRNNNIVMSANVAIKHLERIIKHEMGHVLGLRHHLDCVMSPYYITSNSYCNECKHTLSRYLRINGSSIK